MRHYLFPDGGEPLRLSRRVVEGLVTGDDALPQYASTNQRVLGVLVANDDGAPQEIVHTEAEIWQFDENGKINLALREAAFGYLSLPSERKTADEKVVSLQPKIARKQLDAKHRWKPTAADIEILVGDIWPKKGSKRLKEVKGTVPKRPSLTYEARHAIDAIAKGFWEVSHQLERLTEPAVKGLAFEARHRAGAEPQYGCLYRAIAEMADERLDILRRRRTGKGIWYALVEGTRWTEEHVGMQVFLFHEKCSGQAAAVKAAQRLLAQHADKFAAGITVEASVLTDIEWNFHN